MCKLDRKDLLNEVAVNNIKIVNSIIKYINNKLNINLYNNSNIKELYNNNEIKKIKNYYKTVVNRLISLIERNAMQENLLLDAIQKSQRVLKAKQALTVKSPAISDGVHSGSIGNSQEKILISIGEEIKKQEALFSKYDQCTNQHRKEKELIKSFINLSPRTTGVEVLIRHYVEGQDYKEIKNTMQYYEVYNARKRAIDDLAIILMVTLEK